MEELNHLWSRDEQHVYCVEKRIRASRESFRVLNEIFAMDEAHVYYINGKADWIDARTFEVLDDGFYAAPDEWDNRRIYHGYARDKNNVYFHDMMFGKPKAIKGADPRTIVRLKWDYAADSKHVYFSGSRLPSCDPRTVKIFSNLFARDARHCFYLNRKIGDADSNTFQLFAPLKPNTPQFFAHDAQCVYYQDWRLTGSDPHTFVLTDDGYGRDRTGVWDVRRISSFNPHLRP